MKTNKCELCGKPGIVGQILRTGPRGFRWYHVCKTCWDYPPPKSDRRKLPMRQAVSGKQL